MKYLAYFFIFFISSSYMIEKSFDDSNMVFVKGGEFILGENRIDSLFPRRHKVFLNDFYMGKYETTLEEFSEFVNETGYVTQVEKGEIAYVYVWDSTFNRYMFRYMRKPISWRSNSFGEPYELDQYSNYPVALVGWYDAVNYCKWLSKKTGNTYRLPTEAEWEYAGMGGENLEDYVFAGSNVEDSVSCNSSDSTRLSPCQIGTKKPNSLGLYDMSGNMQEWCLDWIYLYDEDLMPNYSLNTEYNNPIGLDSTSNHKVVRGGNFRYDFVYWIGMRGEQLINKANIYTGFRVVREVK